MINQFIDQGAYSKQLPKKITPKTLKISVLLTYLVKKTIKQEAKQSKKLRTQQIFGVF